MARYARRRASRSAPRRSSYGRRPVRRSRVAYGRSRRAASGRTQTVRIVVSGSGAASAAPMIMSEAGRLLSASGTGKRSKF